MKRAIILIICILVPLCTACSSGKTPRDDERIETNVVVDGLNISGLTVQQARESLRRASQARLADSAVTLTLDNESERIPLSELGVSFDLEESLAKAAALRKKGGERSITSAVFVARDALESRIDAYIAKHSCTATNASVSIDPSQATPLAYREERDGVSIERAQLVERVYDAALNARSSAIEVEYSVMPAAVTVRSILEKQTLIAQYQTSFAKSSLSASGRVHNIVKAAAAINGMTLQPGEAFDCNATLGDRTEENGWAEAPGIRNGKYENEYGGGVCQVSSTLFNAVMMADLTITERHPHSWPMGYVDIGRDATISTGGKNFCFVNTSDAPIYIYVHVDEQERVLTASIYGAPLDGDIRIEIASEATGTIESAGEVWMLDESLPFQTRVVEREPRDGKTSITYKEYYTSDGTLMRREVAYQDTYRAIDGLVYVSTDLYYS